MITAPGGIRRRAWGRVHMMRSGKRSEENTGNGDWVPDERSVDVGSGDEAADLGIDLEALDNTKLRRVTRSGAAGQQSWTQNFLRSLRNRSGLPRRGGRRSWFGGGHMMRSGKRSSWGAEN